MADKPLPPVFDLIQLAKDAVDGKPTDPLATFKGIVNYFIHLAEVPDVKPKKAK